MGEWMRILIITQYFWPETFRINDLSVDLVKAGHQVTVLTGIPNYPNGSYFNGYGILKKRHENYHGVKVIRVPLVPRGKGGKLNLILNYFSFAFSSMLLGPLVCRDKADVIFVYEPSPITVGLPAIVFKKIKRAPMMFWVQDLWPESLSATGSIHSEKILAWVRKLAKFIYLRCDQVLVQSKAFIPSILKLGIPAEKIAYFPNAAEDLYGIVEQHKEKTDLPHGFRLVYTGNIGVSQSFQTILDAATLLQNEKNIHWMIVGDGRQKEWLAAQIAERNLSDTIHLVGQKPLEEMPYYYGLADALLVSLKKDPVFSLTIPSKVQSYLASGKPIVATLDGEAANIIQESGAGYVGAAEDAKALAENVLAMYQLSIAERQEMGQHGRRYFEKHFQKERLLVQLQSWMNDRVGEAKCAF